MIQPSGQMINVGNHSLHLLSMGSSKPHQPTIVLESGHGAWSIYWRKVQPEIASFARVCAYDRAGFGWSEAGPQPRSPEQIVNELHTLLHQADELPPYLLVGHSMGGTLVRLFYSCYPQEVTGMVWVDAGHENMAKYIPFWRQGFFSFIIIAWIGGILARLGLSRLLQRQILAGYTSMRTPEEQAMLLAQTSTPKFFDALRHETVELLRQSNWQHAPNSLGNLPVISIEAQYAPEPPKGYPPKRWQQFRQGWKALQDDQAALSATIRRIPLEGGHNIMDERPEIVTNAVKELLQLDKIT